jgi:chemotaxis protein MotB
MGKRKKKSEEAPGADLLQMLTVSLFIILLAFFIMLNAIAVVDQNRKRVALGSLMDSFGILSGGNSLIPGPENQVDANNLSEMTGLIDFSDLIKGQGGGTGQQLVVTEDHRRSVLSIPDERLFNPGGERLLPEGEKMLTKLSKIIQSHRYPVDIIGYMDNGESEMKGWPPPRELSTLRALSVQGFLIKRAGVNPKLLTAYGWGEYHPVASNGTRETRARNRRVDVVFIHEKKSVKPDGAFTFKDFFFNVFDKHP